MSNKVNYYTHEQVDEIISKAKVLPGGRLSVTFPKPAVSLPDPLIMSEMEMENRAIGEIPYDSDAGNVEDDIDAAKRSLIVKGMKLYRDYLKKD